jgi:hypothetical protein
MTAIHPSILEKNGIKEFAVLPYEEFEKMKEDLNDYEDLKLLRQAKCDEANSPTIPLEKAKYILLTRHTNGRAKTHR